MMALEELGQDILLKLSKELKSERPTVLQLFCIPRPTLVSQLQETVECLHLFVFNLFV